MDAFNLRWEFSVRDELSAFGSVLVRGRIRFMFVMSLNDFEQPSALPDEYISASDLKASTESDGWFYIYTCSCGDAACGGFQPVEVVHVGNVTLWNDGPKNLYEFDRAIYTDQIDAMWNQIGELRARHPYYEWSPEVY